MQHSGVVPIARPVLGFGVTSTATAAAEIQLLSRHVVLAIFAFSSQNAVFLVSYFRKGLLVLGSDSCSGSTASRLLVNHMAGNAATCTCVLVSEAQGKPSQNFALQRQLPKRSTARGA